VSLRVNNYLKNLDKIMVLVAKLRVVRAITTLISEIKMGPKTSFKVLNN
jgi:hypothetical protein